MFVLLISGCASERGGMMAEKGMMSNGKGADTYRVTITNLTRGQPLSPPLLATHGGDTRIWSEGGMASPELRALAEDGMNKPLAASLERKATDVVAAGSGDMILPGKDMTFTITANGGDVLTVLTMVSATNDGFTGLHNMALGAPVMEHMTDAFDAGTEENTERTSDTAAPAMGKGHVPTTPQAPIGPHLGITGRGDLDPAKYGWVGPVARVVVTKQ